MCAKTKIILSPSIMRTNSPSSVSQFPSSFESDDAKQSILIISENMPPQVNGIARRVGMYSNGLRDKGCNVDVVHPDSGWTKALSHVNPWNFTSRMMVINPLILYHLLSTPYDIVHIVMPANLSAMLVLAAFKIFRCISKSSEPALIVSWHCNIVDYMKHFSMIWPLQYVGYMFFFLLFGMLPLISDRILTPTKKTEPLLVKLWGNSSRKMKKRSGVCYTGVNKTEFSPDSRYSEWGETWSSAKDKYLAKVNKKYLIVCWSTKPEKGVDELVKVLKKLPDCALWLVGDGPHRPQLENLSQGLPVKFLGYQSGEALHSVYSVGDIFVCPSLTETFGQTVNEALASQVRVALPRVPVFEEAYGEVIPNAAFWKPLDQLDMASCIMKTLTQDSRPDINKLKSWDDACTALLDEYNQAAEDLENRHHFTLLTLLYFPLWCVITAATVTTFFVFSQIRHVCGGSVRLFFKSATKDVLIKVKSFHRLPSFDSLDAGEKRC